MRSIVLTPDAVTGPPCHRIGELRLQVRTRFIDAVKDEGCVLGEFTTRAFIQMMCHGFIPDIVRGEFEFARARLVNSFFVNGGEVRVSKLMGGAIRIRIVRPMRDLNQEAQSHAEAEARDKPPARRNRRRGDKRGDGEAREAPHPE